MSLLAHLRRLFVSEKTPIPIVAKRIIDDVSSPIPAAAPVGVASGVRQFSGTESTPPPTEARGRGLIHRSGGYEETRENERFNGIIEETMGDYFTFAYYTTIAGTKHKNDDGSSRTAAIRKCATCEQLVLHREPSNPYDPNAIAVFRNDGSQLGYIPRRSGQEIVNGMRLRHEEWTALFRKPTRHPDTDRVVGAVILLMQLKSEKA
jgi:hypothetical protein